MMKKILLLGICFLLLFQHSILSARLKTMPHKQSTKLLKPQRLKIGDSVGLINSSYRTAKSENVTFAKERLEALGLKVILGKTLYQQDGYFAGTDQARAADLNAMFANPNVKAIFEMGGGWGCARILPYLDYAMIRKNPKILIGFSDITSLLLAIGKKSDLISYYGPMAELPWPDFTVTELKKILFDGTTPVTLQNPSNEVDPTKDIIQTKHRIHTLVSGNATGVLIGGNLSIIVSLLGTPYEPNWQGKILFLEDVTESHYRIDRMMAQLQEAGVLSKIRGLIFGTCKDCYVDIDVATSTNASFPIEAILRHYTKPYHIPVFMGSMIGHYPKIFTLPEGTNVEMNANDGTIKLLESPVVR
jgi:muramoyltetrapeptide carboxypeptidase